jgi:hypothetical protein
MLDNWYGHVETCNGDVVAIPTHIHDMHYVLYAAPVLYLAPRCMRRASPRQLALRIVAFGVRRSR